MDERMKTQIEKLFEDAPKTRKAMELKEELLGNSQERYRDLVEEGMKAEDAYLLVINSLGNVTELFQDLEDLAPEEVKEMVNQDKKFATVKTAAVGIYIFSVVQFLAFGMIGSYINTRIDMIAVGFILMLLLAIIPTCMLVYAGSMYPKYKRKENTVVEEFKEWKSNNHKNKSIKNAVLFVAWAFTILLYFVVSFTTYYWFVTWIIFLVGICLHAIIELMYRLKEAKS